MLTSGPRQTGTPARTDTPFIPALEGLRGIAIVGVIAHHLGYLSGGFFGVDVFFALSGFLITTVLLQDDRWGSARGGLGFWKARVRRLEPALLVVTAAVLGAAALLEAGERSSAIGLGGLSTLTYTANWYDIAARHAYTTPFPAQLPFGHMWSLAIEAQLYLVAFAIVIMCRTLPRRTLALRCAAGVVAAASTAAMVWGALVGASDTFLYKSTPTRAAPFAIGMLLATWRNRPDAPEPRARTLTIARDVTGWAALALAIALSLTVSLTDAALWTAGFPLAWVAASAITWAAAGSTITFGAALSAPPLRWVGRISYSLYLWYWPIVLYVNAERTGVHGRALDVVQAITIVLVGWASYALVEQRSRFGPDSIVLRACLVAWLILLVAAAGMSATSHDSSRSGPRSAPVVGLPSALVVGDSVAADLAQDGLIPGGPAAGINIASVAKNGCTPLAGAGELLDPLGAPIVGDSSSKDCSADWPDAVASGDPDVVVVLFGGYASASVVIDGTPAGACDGAFQIELRSRLEAFHATLTTSGARLKLVTAASPDATGSPYEEVQGELDHRFACWNQVLEEFTAQHPADTDLVDLAGFVCPAPGRCRTLPDGSPLREDGLHLRGDAARSAAAWMLPQLVPPG